MTRAVGWAGTVFAWVVSTTAFRVWQRLSQVRGGVLVAGIAYSAFFSLFPLVALAFTVFGVVLGSSSRLQEDVTSYLVATLPTVFEAAKNSDTTQVYPPDLVAVVIDAGALTSTGLIAVVALVWSGLGWVTSLRLGIRAAMHLSVHDFNPIIAKIRDFGIALLLGGAVLVSAVVSVTAHSATEQMLQGIGISSNIDGRILTRLVVAVPILALDTGLFWLQYRLLAASPLPASTLRLGALAAGVGFGALKLASGVLLPQLLTASVLTQVFGVLIGLLVWFNLLARITLLGAAWAGLRAEEIDGEWAGSYTEYDDNDDRFTGHVVGGVGGDGSTPARRTLATAAPWQSVLDAPDGPSVRSQDRVVLAAGIILGATTAVGIRALASSARLLTKLTDTPTHDDQGSTKEVRTHQAD